MENHSSVKMKKYIPYIIIGALLLIIAQDIFFGGKQEVKIETLRDTSYIERIDTVFVDKPIANKVIVTDTLYKDSIVFIDDSYLLRESKTYYSDLYKAVVSGINPSLDSIQVYNKEKIITITESETKTIYKNPTRVYLYTGFDKGVNGYIPKIGASLHIPMGLLIGADVGIDNNNPVYGIMIGYKIIGK